MLDKFMFTCNAVLPIILLIALGYVLKRLKIFPDSFWKLVNKLCFRVCLPVLLFYNIYQVNDIEEIGKNWQIIVYAVVATLVVFLIGLILAITLIKDPKQKGVILQCVFRSNYAIIGIPLAQSLAKGDPTVVGIASVVSAVSIPLFNILAIIALNLFVKEGQEKPSVRSICLKILKNPLIIGVFAGIVALLIRLAIPYSIDTEGIKVYRFSIEKNIPFLYKAIGNVAQIASPLALIALGGDFAFSAISRLKFQITIGVVLRVVVVPVGCLLAAYAIGFRGTEFPSLIALFGTPVAVSSVPMTTEMKSDDELAGQLVVWTSILSAFTLFFIIFLCTQVGIF